MSATSYRSALTCDPTDATLVDGVTCTACGDDFIVHGGPAGDRIWRLHLPSATWTEIPCFGAVPLPRVFHAAAYFKGFLLMCGGEILTGPHNAHCYAARVNHYELNLDTYEWSCIDCFGEVPLNRSHHTLTAVKDDVVLFGGKPILPGIATVAVGDRALTSMQLQEIKQDGFYDVHIFHPLSRTWRRVSMYDPIAPMVWGHTACLYQSTHILYFGGCDVSQTDPSNPNVPVATLSNAVAILSLANYKWQICAMPAREQSCPVPRALHFAICDSEELAIAGGFTVNRFGQVLVADDSWLWSVRRGTWRRVDFCMPQFTSKRLLSCLYGSQWIIAPSMTSVFFLEMSRVSHGWQRAACSIQRLIAAPQQRGRVEPRSELLASPDAGGAVYPRHQTLPSPARGSNDPLEVPFEVRSPPQRTTDGAAEGGSGGGAYHRSAADVDVAMMEVQRLRDEVEFLKDALLHSQSMGSTRHQVLFRQRSPGEDTGKKLQRWSEVSPEQRRPSASAELIFDSHGRHVDSSEADASVTLSQRVGSANAGQPGPEKGKDMRTANDGGFGFVDREVLDEATKKKLEVFRRLQAKSRNKAQLTEAALRVSAIANADLSSPESQRLLVRDHRKWRQGPASDDSDSSEENLDIHQVAELGLQVHRAKLNNSESRRQLLFYERKRRIQQLQDRLRALEIPAQSGRGGSPDRTTLGLAMFQAESLRQLMDHGRADDDASSAVPSSMAVVVPGTHDPPETLRSDSFASLSSSDSHSQHLPIEFDANASNPNAERPDLVRSVSGVSHMTTSHDERALGGLGGQAPNIIVPGGSDMHEATPLQGPDTLPMMTIAELEATETAAELPPPPPVEFQAAAAVFRGFQRRQQSSAPKPESTPNFNVAVLPTSVAEAPSSGRSLKLRSEVNGLPELPPIGATPSSDKAPGLAALQTQWDVLQNALTSRGGSSSRVFRSAAHSTSNQ